MQSTDYSNASTARTELSQRQGQNLRDKSQRFHNNIAKDQRQSIFRKLRHSHFTLNAVQVPPNVDLSSDQSISNAGMEPIFQLQLQADSNPNVLVQQPNPNLQNQTNYWNIQNGPFPQLNYRSQPPFADQPPYQMGQNISIYNLPGQSEFMIVPESQEQVNDIQFVNQSNFINQPQLQDELQQQFNPIIGSQMQNQALMSNSQFQEPRNHFIMSPSQVFGQSLMLSPHNSPINSPQNGCDFSFGMSSPNSPNPLQYINSPQNNNYSFNSQQYSPPNLLNHAIIYPPNCDISFGFQQQFSPPQMHQNMQYIEYPFINQSNDILPPHINSPQYRKSPNQSDGPISFSLLSNAKILSNPQYVNPYLEMDEELPNTHVAKHIIQDNKRKMDQIKWQNLQNHPNNFTYRQVQQPHGVSPFIKNKKSPELYQAFELNNKEQNKHHQDQSIENLSQNKKKQQKPQQAPKTNVKKQTKQVQPKNKSEGPKKPPIFKNDNQSHNQLITKQEKSIKIASNKQQTKQKPLPKQSKAPEVPQLKQQKHRQQFPLSLEALCKQYIHIKLKQQKYFMFDKLLGKGSFAEVYLGYSTLLKQRIAIKKMKIKRQKQMYQVEYLQEVDHKNVIKLYDYLKYSDGTCYLFLEFCDYDLRKRVEMLTDEKLGQRQELKIRVNFIEQLIEGMNALNQKGYIHRDLKLENILVKNDVLKIGDFGLCRKVNNKLEIESVRCGTPYTMAPEIYFHPKSSYEKAVYTQKADIFSLAVIFHELIYNEHPFNYDQIHLKSLRRININHAQELIKKVCQESSLDISWIRQIIDRGLLEFEERITWEEIMKIYTSRNSENKKINRSEDKNQQNDQQSTKNNVSTDIAMPPIVKSSIEKTLKTQKQLQKQRQKVDDKSKSKDEVISEKIVEKGIANAKVVINNDNFTNIKQQKVQSKKIQNGTSAKKERCNIINLSKKALGDPQNSSQNKNSSTFFRNPMFKFLPDENSFELPVNEGEIEVNKREKEDKKESEAIGQILHVNQVINPKELQGQNFSVIQKTIKEEKIESRKEFNIIKGIVVFLILVFILRHLISTFIAA